MRSFASINNTEGPSHKHLNNRETHFFVRWRGLNCDFRFRRAHGQSEVADQSSPAIILFKHVLRNV